MAVGLGIALAGLAVAAYSAHQGNQMTLEERANESPGARSRRLGMFWAGIGGAFAAGTPLLSAGGSGGQAASTAGAEAATVEAGAATAGIGGGVGTATGPTGTAAATGMSGEAVAAGGTQAAGAGAMTAPEFVVADSAAAGSGAPWGVKASYYSSRVQAALTSKKGQMASQVFQSAASPQQEQQPMAAPPPRRQQFTMDMYEEKDNSMTIQANLLSEENRGSLRAGWWEA